MPGIPDPHNFPHAYLACFEKVLKPSCSLTWFSCSLYAEIIPWQIFLRTRRFVGMMKMDFSTEMWIRAGMALKLWKEVKLPIFFMFSYSCFCWHNANSLLNYTSKSTRLPPFNYPVFISLHPLKGFRKSDILSWATLSIQVKLDC